MACRSGASLTVLLRLFYSFTILVLCFSSNIRFGLALSLDRQFNSNHNNNKKISVMSDKASLARLQARVAAYIAKNHHTVPLSLGIAGGGSTLLSTMASTPGASQLLLEGHVLYARTSFRDYIQHDPPSLFCSPQGATLLSEAATSRSLFLSGYNASAIGVGCTSSLKSSPDKVRSSLVHIRARFLGGCVALFAELYPIASRSRFDEDVLVGHLILSCLELAVTQDEPWLLGTENIQTETLPQQTVYTCQTDEGDTIRVTKSVHETENQLRYAADQVLLGSREAVLLVPSTDSEASFQVMTHVRLPKTTLVLPGSFNPPHLGHIELGQACRAQVDDCDMVLFEISIKNADKPSLESEEVARRVQQFCTMDIPYKWGILLTNAPLFQEKADTLQSMLEQGGTLHFGIGSDTMVRLIDPKYYGNDRQAMLRALSSMDCQFVVGGRMQQKVADPTFETGAEHLSKLAEEVRKKFNVMQDFRVDVSSTELRNQEPQKDS